MNKKALVIYDEDSLYAGRLQQFLCKKEGNHFQVFSFTDKEDLYKACQMQGSIKAEILLVAESCFDKELLVLGAKHIFILNETGLRRHPEYANLNKYQSAGTLFQQILLEYADREKEVIPRFYGKKKAKIVGVYTPITRCFQTGFSLALSQVLGKKGRVLYINFEQYSGFSGLFQKGYIKDLSDLVYFFTYSGDKFLYWLEGVVEHFGKVEYVPPVLTGASLAEVSKGVWTDMLELISTDAGYDYIVLDLSDSMQGIYDVLDLCDRIYTITRSDPMSTARLNQFNEILKNVRFANLKEKIHYLTVPFGAKKEVAFEEMIHRELTDYANEVLGDDLYE